jgi:hypothetical protein
MTEQQEVVADFGAAGVLGGIRWAYLSATARVLDDYSEAAGHDATWVGITRFTLFRDRLDRVFACGRYAVPEGDDASISLDILRAELTERDIASMPPLATDLVTRADLNGSPGWAWQKWRWLLASCAFGKIDELPWSQKSPTKQRVALQPNPDPDPTLFDELAADEVGGLEALFAQAQPLDRDTLVVAHSQDVDHDGRELVIGRAQLNFGGGEAWHWYQDLLETPSAEGGRATGNVPPQPGPKSVPDAPVRLRRPAAEQPGKQASGEA